ncbi:hypothetical protein TWF225_000138 [Orbilia oligospora]|uniref:Pinin/SDK/MemA protein domain-containing protein n=1 Tax=Orbilia oligospora TaxID=2813651 RepID=A0A8H2DZU6_ORBOL|nr:hypothetical protein TWF225_000138 [Orbilia oligospora]KAF3233719.1 hypothetical protein TWF128_002910 [Orbilia oligospora]KAF3256201.1 hypothetical protein TWF217_006447 [Orbilia oligospora]KAF3297498.1 hypothetical protein TWF132_005929 [Orbilia oligospora]TGJ69995.1 hypothetical protein EYR41_005993 [Orbilia oligospora]
MSTDTPIIASAIVIPPNATQPSPPPSSRLKRRESSDDTPTDSVNPKRTRLAPGSGQDEKSRSQRLFGSFLGNLGRVSQDSRTRKRQEVDAKMQEKMRVQEEEDKADLKRNRELKEEEKKAFANHAAQIRRRNESHMANFLATKSKSKIYYRPWKLLRSQELVIEKQKEMAARNRSPSPSPSNSGHLMDISTAQLVSPTTIRDQKREKSDEELNKEDITMQEDISAVPSNQYQSSRRHSKDLGAQNKEPSPVPSVRPGGEEEEEEEMVEY